MKKLAASRLKKVASARMRKANGTQQRRTGGIKTMVKENKMSEAQARRMVAQIVETGEDRWKNFEKSFEQMLSTGLDSGDVTESGEIGELKARVDDLERLLFTMQNPLALNKQI